MTRPEAPISALAEAEAARDALLLRVRGLERAVDAQRHRAEAAEDALTDLAAIARGAMADPWPADEAKPDTIAGRAYDEVCRLVRERDAANERADKAAAERDSLSREYNVSRRLLADAQDKITENRRALRQIHLIATDIPYHLPLRSPSGIPLVLTDATVEAVVELRRTRDAVRRALDVCNVEREAARCNLTTAHKRLDAMAAEGSSLRKERDAFEVAYRKAEKCTKRLVRAAGVLFVALVLVGVGLLHALSYLSTLADAIGGGA